MTKEIKDGIYYDMPAEEYFAMPFVSRSSLTPLCRGLTPAHYKGRLEKPMVATKAMTFGTRAHSAVLEPDKKDEFEPLPKDIKRRAGAAYELLCAENPGVTFLPAGEWSEMKDGISSATRVAENVNAHAEAKAILGRLPYREVSFVWTDPATGIRCKARSDMAGDSPCEMADLKTTGKTDPYIAVRAAYDHGLDAQVAFYGDGWSILHGIDPVANPCSFSFIFVESTWPHLVSVCDGLAAYDEASETTHPRGYLMHGREAYQTALQTIKECTETGVWPGHSPEVYEMVLPKWRGLNA